MRMMLSAFAARGRKAFAGVSQPKWSSGFAMAIGLIGFSFASLMIAGGGQAQASQGCSFINGQPLTDDPTLENRQILAMLFDVGDQITVNNIWNPNNETVFMWATDFNYTVAQGVPPFTFSIQSGESGPAAGRFTIQFGSQSVSGPSATAILTCVAASKFNLKQKQSPVRLVGQSYSQTNDARGGKAPYVYSVSAGVLPAGTTLNSSTGEVSGAPTIAGLFSYTIQATDSRTSSPRTVAGTLSGMILPPLL